LQRTRQHGEPGNGTGTGKEPASKRIHVFLRLR
jgi:hypothetical protein